VLGLGIGLSLVLIVLGVPRVVASLLKGPAIGAVSDAHDGDLLSPGQLETAIRYLRRAADWEASVGLRTDLGFLLLSQAEQIAVDGPKREALLDEAGAVLRDGLARGPVRPHAWLRLAYVEMMQSGPSAEVAAVLGRSLEAGRFVGEISLVRMELLLRNWAHLPFEVRALVGEQIRYVWRRQPGKLIVLARITGTTQILRLSLRSIPGSLEMIDRHLAQSPG